MPDDVALARASMRRMWHYATDLKTRENNEAVDNEVVRNLPFHEWLLRRFVSDLDELVTKGLRSKYVEVEESLPVLRGRLVVGENIRRNSFNLARFHCRFDEFSLSRPENRLIRSAVDIVRRETNDPDTRRRANALRDLLQPIPPSSNTALDFALWARDRSMLHYRSIRQTCEWLLTRSAAAPIVGQSRVVGRLVRMNDVFERYVQRWLDERRALGFDIVTTAPRKKMLAWTAVGRERLLNMKPDIVIQKKQNGRTAVAVLDMKWKDRTAKTPISREDLYQLFAYAKTYLADDNGAGGGGKLLAAVFPTANVNARPTEFRFEGLPELRCFCLPFLLPVLASPQQGPSPMWQEGLLVDEALLDPIGLGAARAVG